MSRLSAGLLLYRTGSADQIEVLLVHPGGPFWKGKNRHAWSIPKGEYLEGQDPLGEAEREFAEEIGVSAPGGPRIDLGSVRQASGKQVHAWAIEAGSWTVSELASNEFEMEWPPKSGRMLMFPEVDRMEWMTIPEALPRIVKAQAGFFDRLREALDSESGPLGNA
ncbi:MAG TPA: NUDIX domain-containing protein [Acidimicrobiales bacterium]|nr:NUDIX domain-containing protein [Acidimicrobiales bacterium]